MEPAVSDAQAPVTLAPGAEAVGLAVMIADLIRQNLAQRPGKWSDFSRLRSRISLEARDAEVSITLAFSEGGVTVHGGIQGDPEIRISATAEALLRLAAVRIVAGLPFLFGSPGRELRAALITGQVRIAGVLRRPAELMRFTRLVSVND